MEENKLIEKTVRETLSGLGFNADDIHEMQADLMYLRRMRKGSEEMGQWIRRSIITVTIPTLLFVLWEAFKHALR